MSNFVLLNLIVPRDSENMVVDFLQENGIATCTTTLCRGTAGKNLLSMLGLQMTEKLMFSAMLPRPSSHRILRKLVSQMGLNRPGQGIAYTLPATSIGGASARALLLSGQKEMEEVEDMPQTFLYELLIAIVNRGHSDSVMDAAREAGAFGGTIFHARGTRPEDQTRFFGVSIADEKEMLMILTTSAQKAEIMRSIMDKAGMNSPAHTVMFSLPVESVAGLRSLMEAAGEKE